MSLVMGKSREELFAMAKERHEGKKALPAVGVKEDPTFSAKMKSEVLRKEDAPRQSSSGLINVEVSSLMPSSGNSFTGKKPSNMIQMQNNMKAEVPAEPRSDRSIGAKKLKRLEGMRG